MSIKIALLGSSGVGKTCIIKRYTENIFDPDSASTPGASYSQKYLKDKNVNLDLWDTAGQEQYRSLVVHFYKDAFIVCLVYDITNQQSFQELKDFWYKNLKEYGEKYTIVAIVGNKSDCYENEEVKEEEARKYAEEIKASFFLVSAKNGNNINLLFDSLVTQYLEPEFTEKIRESIAEKGNISKLQVENNKNEKKKKKGCC